RAFVAVAVLDVFSHRPPEMPLPDRNQPVEAFFFDRPHEALRVRVPVRRARRGKDDADTRVPESTPHVTAPLPIPITDRDVRRTAHTTGGNRLRAYGLLPEQRLGIRRGSEDLQTSGGQIDDEPRVVGDEASPHPDFRREEIGPGNCAPVRAEKRLPRG